MAGHPEIESILLKAYDLRKSSDIEAVLSALAPNAVYHLSGSEKASPIARRASGQAELRAMLKQIIDSFDLVEYTIKDMIIDGTRAAVRWTGKFRFRPTQKVLESDIAHFWTLEDGKITALVEFCDTAYVSAVLLGADVS
jgi:hypothetical protein